MIPRRRTREEQNAYMAGQRAALRLAREKGVEYAARVIEATQRATLACRTDPDADPDYDAEGD